MTLLIGKQYSEQIGYFIVREDEGTCELQVQDCEAMETREEAERWIDENGLVGVDYWICAPVTRTSLLRVVKATTP